MSIVKTSSKSQIIIPKEIRKILGITPGQKVLLRIVDDHAELRPIPKDIIKAMRGILKEGGSLAEELLLERKKDNTIDEKDSL